MRIFNRTIALMVVGVVVAGGTVCLSEAIASEHMVFSACSPSFDEDFKHLDVTERGPSRWIAHTPWFGDFGDARFANPGSDSSFTTGPDGLTITASQDASGKWKSGLLSSTDPESRGFAATHGYFEMVSTFPPGKGTWPAFWLLTADRKANPDIEIDVIEYYGHWTDRYQATVTVRPKGGVKSHSVTHWINVPPGSLVDGPHAYGVSVGTTDIVFFLDRQEVWRTPTPPEQQKPLGVLLNLALGSGWPIKETPNPSRMVVNRVSYYPNLEACGIAPHDAGNQ